MRTYRFIYNGYLPSSPYTATLAVDCLTPSVALQNFKCSLSNCDDLVNPHTSHPYVIIGETKASNNCSATLGLHSYFSDLTINYSMLLSLFHITSEN